MADEVFGPYHLQEVIGRGGMGVVYRAFDTRRDRIVALKRLPHDLASDESFQARFRRESRLVARLNEPHIIPIHDFGEIDGQLYLDMRLVDGQDLSKLISDDGGRLDPTFAVDVLGQVASALGAAHEAGLMHRDIKPSNVLVTGIADGDRSSPFAYLVDFGIARAMGNEGTNLTQTTDWFGTVAYMAPERISGSSGDARSDIYSLACLLYQCVIGNAPFTGEALQVLFAHVNNPPPSASGARGSVPVALDAVIKRGMAKNPDDRYQTAGQFASAARAAMRGGQTLPPGVVPPTQPIRTGAPRHAGPPQSVPPTGARHAGPPQSVPPTGGPISAPPPTGRPHRAGPPNSVPPARHAGPPNSIPPVVRQAGPPNSGPRPPGANRPITTSGPMPPRTGGPGTRPDNRVMTIMVTIAIIVVIAAIIAVIIAVNSGDDSSAQGSPTPTVNRTSAAPSTTSPVATTSSVAAGWANYNQFTKLIGDEPESTDSAFRGATCRLRPPQSDVPGMVDQVFCNALSNDSTVTFAVGRFSSKGAVDNYFSRLTELKYKKEYWPSDSRRDGLLYTSPSTSDEADVVSSICALPTFVVDFYARDSSLTSAEVLDQYWRRSEFPDTTPARC